MDFKVIDCCPCPADLYPILKAIKDETGCVFASIYRGEDPKAQKYLTGGPPCFKHNQAWIYTHYPPGVANPPGRSTHECKNDGVAYPWWRVFASIPWWACGIDVDDAHVQAFCNAARRHGWIATVTYPGSPVEYHHVNFRKQPVIPFRDIKPNARGPRVLYFTYRLQKMGYISKATQHYYGPVVTAIKKFQKQHRLVVDGIIGPATWNQINVQYRYWQKHHKGK